jgi:tRNA threonylcarbamoyladenosine biosynthesis protein TsaE
VSRDPLVVVTTSAAQTQDLAAALGQIAVAGDLVLLAGEMGAGKTAFAQGFARGLGIADQVTSPTFTIVQEYSGGRLNMHHLDVYRLETLREVADLGLSEMLDEDAVMLVEWGDAVLPALPDQYLELRLAFGDDDDERRIELRGVGGSWPARSRQIADAVAPWRVERGGPTC